MAFIQLTKINSDNTRPTMPDRFSDTDDIGENARTVGEMRTVKATINTAAIRCFYPRKDERPGCRITFIDGGGFAVTESFDEISALLNPTQH